MKSLFSFRQREKLVNNPQNSRYSYFILLMCLCCLPTIASADVTDTLSNAASILLDWAKPVAVLALMGTGFGCFYLGRINKGWFIAVLFGTALIFGASHLVDKLTN